MITVKDAFLQVKARGAEALVARAIEIMLTMEQERLFQMEDAALVGAALAAGFEAGILYAKSGGM